MTTARPPFVSFLSDYGRTDEFVGVCHAVMLDIAPERTDRRRHARHPGVRRARGRPRAGPRGAVPARGHRARGGRSRASPPTGAASRSRSRTRCWSVPTTACSRRRSRCWAGPGGCTSSTNTQYQLPAPGPTFAGRDVMAPAAAHLATGVPISVLGQRGRSRAAHARDRAACPTTAARAGSPARCSGSTATATASSMSHPNSSTRPACAQGDALEVTVADAAGVRTGRRARWVRAFAEAKPSELVLLVDSYGMCTLALDRRSAAAELGLRNGERGHRRGRGCADLDDAPGVPVMFGREPRP